MFLYVGVEVVAGDTIISYGISLNIPVEEAKFFTLFTLMAMVVTYALDSRHDPQKIDLEFMKFLGENQIPFCIVFTSGFTSVLFVAALGIANALVWPAIWPLALTGLGKFTKTASALLIMAISGGAVLPPLYGALVDHKKEELLAIGTNSALPQLYVPLLAIGFYYLVTLLFFIMLFGDIKWA